MFFFFFIGLFGNDLEFGKIFEVVILEGYLDYMEFRMCLGVLSKLIVCV